MNKTIKLFLGLVILMTTITFVSCEKDEEEEVTPPVVVLKSHIKYDNTEYPLAAGYLENYGLEDSTYNTDLVLLSSGFTVHESNGEIDSLSGTGDGIIFEMYSSQGDKLDIGDYIYDENETYASKTITYGDLVLNYSIADETGFEASLEDGKVTVISNGAEYELSFEGTDENGKAVSGYYKGTLKYYDYSTKSAKSKKARF